jgi:peptidoglycan/LPS O-acetylase OafA/YrhL
MGLRPMPGWVAVEGFFVISGFYMALVLDNKYPSTPAGTAVFYANRYLRLYPSYFLVLVLSVVALAVFGAAPANSYSLARIQDALQHMDIGSRSYILLANLTMLGTDLSDFLRDTGNNLAFTTEPPDPQLGGYHYLVIPQGWTLGVELAFYLVAPVLLRLRRLWIVAIALASLFLRLALPHLFGLESWAHNFFPCVLFLFLAGALALKARSWPLRFQQGWRPIVLLAILPVVIIYYEHIPVGESLRYWMFLGLLTGLMKPLFEVSKNLAWDRFLGELSYPLYLCHLLVGYVVDNTLGPSFLTFRVLASLALAALLYMAVDRRIDAVRATLAERMKSRVRYRSPRLVKGPALLRHRH